MEITIFRIFLISKLYQPCSESPGYDSDPNPDQEDDSGFAAKWERKIDEDDIPTILDGNYGRSVDECATRMTQNGVRAQEFRDGFLREHQNAFGRCWKKLGLNVPLNPDKLELKRVVDTAAECCLAFDFSDKMLSHMNGVIQKACSAENMELVMDCFSKAAGKIMKRLLNYLAAIPETNETLLYYQENPTLLICILAQYMLIFETSWISSKDREIFLRQLAQKMQCMLAPDMLLHVHKMSEACEGDGGIHNNTRKFMSFIGQVVKFDKVLAITGFDKVLDITGLPHEYERLASVDVRDVRIDLHSVIPKLLCQILLASQTLNPDLLLIAKLNNVQFILDKVMQMGLDTTGLQILAHSDVSYFVKVAWSGVSKNLNSTGFFPFCWKPKSLNEKRYIKAFHKTCSYQQDYVIINYELRKRVQKAIISEIISPYEVFQFANARELESIVRKLYEGRLLNFNHVFR